ncbi:protein of unknown function [Methylorubrum extorquens]|uniref:Uncharacterized protein n=1 Tax=Methylorubrum extorquens TaxID=408 RepID=A0A2N9ATX3_METEX|nr:protein of unknown function [Methylorubrum extorquens]
MTTNPIALAKIGEWTFACGDPPEVLVRELSALGFVILPGGTVEALSDAMWQLLDDMGAGHTCVCLAAKAKARVAYEPFRFDADGEEAPLDYTLEAAQAVVSDLEWQHARMAGRDRA